MAAPRAAIIGAGKIGRHHAKWYHHAGCGLVGFAVSRPESIATRAADMASETGGGIGPGYTDVAALLAETQPELVSVCSPATLHYEHARAALAAGAHVLCEKPLVWHADAATALAQAQELCDLAAQQNRILATNLQYSYAAAAYREVAGEVGRPQRLEATLESRGRGAERSPQEVWLELGPHALSLVLALLPTAVVDLDTVQVTTAPRTAIAEFALRTPDGPVAARVEVGQRLEGDLVRRFGINGALVDYAGRNNAAGVYCTYLSREGVEHEYPDLMRHSIETFVAAASGSPAEPVSGDAGRSNLEVQLAVGRHLADD